MNELSVAEIAQLVNGAAHGAMEARITGVAPLERAGPAELAFVANPRYLTYLQGARAGVVLVPEALAELVPEHLTYIIVADPHVALYQILPRLYPRKQVEPGLDATARIHPTAQVAEDATIGPFVVIGAGVRIGPRTQVGPHTVIGDGARIGEQTVLDSHVTIYDGVVIGDRCMVYSGARIGRDGFGFVWHDGGHRKVPQVGGCVIEDDVEIGANVVIDRGSIGDSGVGKGTKIDNLVHLGHNIRIGSDVFLVAQVGVAGSTKIGDRVVFGGQAGVGGHLDIGAGARIGAQAGVTTDIPPGESYSGYPARPHREALRAQGGLFRLPELIKRVRALEKAIFGDRT